LPFLLEDWHSSMPTPRCG